MRKPMTTIPMMATTAAVIRAELMYDAEVDLYNATSSDDYLTVALDELMAGVVAKAKSIGGEQFARHRVEFLPRRKTSWGPHYDGHFHTALMFSSDEHDDDYESMPYLDKSFEVEVLRCIVLSWVIGTVGKHLLPTACDWNEFILGLRINISPVEVSFLPRIYRRTQENNNVHDARLPE